MLYSKANLTVVEAASDDTSRPAVNAVHLAGDGATVAADGIALIAVEPVNEDRVTFPDVGQGVALGENGVSLDPDTVRKAIRNLPKRSRQETQFAALTRNDNRVELTTTDLNQEQRVSGRPRRERFPQWEGILQKAAGRTTTRVCIDRRRLAMLLRTLDAASGKREVDAPVFLEVGGEEDAILMRTVNRSTGQRVIAMLAPLNVSGRWLLPSKWERKVLDRGPKKKQRSR